LISKRSLHQKLQDASLMGALACFRACLMASWNMEMQVPQERWSTPNAIAQFDPPINAFRSLSLQQRAETASCSREDKRTIVHDESTATERQRSIPMLLFDPSVDSCSGMGFQSMQAWIQQALQLAMENFSAQRLPWLRELGALPAEGGAWR
jgi:hypothetical protein